MSTSYTMKSAAQLTQLNPHTIRAWERRYKALEPGRHVNGRRIYTGEDVLRLQMLSQLVKNGHSISSVASLSKDVLNSMVSAQSSKEVAFSEPGCQIVLDQCISALSVYDLHSIHLELESARFLLSSKSFVLSLAVPLLNKVGELVNSGDFVVAQEHALSAILRSILMQILYNLRRPLSARVNTRKDLNQGLTIAAATPEGALHEFGILAASIIVASFGHNPHFFGASMPAKALADAANAVNADMVLIGLTDIPGEHRVTSDEEFALELEMELMPTTKIWWGGHINTLQKVCAEKKRHKFFSSLHDLATFLSKEFGEGA